MTDTRTRPDWQRRLQRRARRLPLHGGALVMGGTAVLACVATGAAGASGAWVPVGFGLAAMGLALCDRFVWRHTRTKDLRARYRALGQRAEALDDRLHALRESEAVHRSLTETFGDLAAQLDGKGRVAFANGVFRDLFPGADALPVAFEGDSAEGETDVETAHGRKVLAWRAMPVLDARGRGATRWIARDVTAVVGARRAAEMQAELADKAAAAKARFLAVAAHEIRNPLSGIRGMAELLATGDLDPRAHPHAMAQVTAIMRSTQALGAVLDDIMDDARMEADRLVIEHEPYDPGAVLEGLCELVGPRAHEKDLDLALHVSRFGAGAVSRHVEGDANRVRQIVANLVGNALKFTASGGVTVTAQVENGLRIAVSDTGSGLTPEEAKRIFDVFASGGDEEANRALARRLGGVGLGLAISRRLAEAMGGRLEVDSRPGEGSTFTLTLPCAAAERPLERSLAGTEVCLVSDAHTLAHPLRRFVEERGGRLVLVSPEAWGGAWTRGPLLVDEAVEAPLPEGAVLLVRDAGRRPSAKRWLRLPWRAASLEQALDGTLGADRPEPSPLRTAIDTGGPGRSVLVAEDDPVTQLLATAVLERAGHRVTLAATGHDAARLFREAAERDEPFALVLLDVNLTVSGETGMDGMSALRGIRAIEKARGLPAVALHVVTGDARPETEAEAVAAGATSVLVKPVPVDVLLGLVPGEEAEARAA